MAMGGGCIHRAVWTSHPRVFSRAAGLLEQLCVLRHVQWMPSVCLCFRTRARAWNLSSTSVHAMWAPRALAQVTRHLCPREVPANPHAEPCQNPPVSVMSWWESCGRPVGGGSRIRAVCLWRETHALSTGCPVASRLPPPLPHGADAVGTDLLTWPSFRDW